MPTVAVYFFKVLDFYDDRGWLIVVAIFHSINVLRKNFLPKSWTPIFLVKEFNRIKNFFEKILLQKNVRKNKNIFLNDLLI